MKKRELLSSQMLEQVNHWRLSGLSKSEWCLRTGIQYQKLNYWIKRINDPVAEAIGKEDFATINKQAGQESDIAIRYPNGVTVSLSPGTSLELIFELINRWPC